MRRMILLSLACMMALLCACASPGPSESPENSEMWTHEENSITQTSPPPQTDSEPTPSEQLPPEEIHEETVQEKDAPVSSIPTGENGDKNQSEPPADTSSKPSKPLATDPTEPVSQPQTSQPAIQTPDPPAETTAPEPEPTPEPDPEPAFDVDYWVSFAISYGQSIGLTYDSTATDCWDNPIIASAQSIYLERDIKSRLDLYAADGMTYFCAWAQLRADGRYDIYIGYA